jgi:predicted phosphodiesterase
MIAFVGDIHGYYPSANNVIEQIEKNCINTVIQLGDFGVHWDINRCDVTDAINKAAYNHRWISCLGNHDNYDYLDSIIDRANEDGLVPYGELKNSSRVLIAPRNTTLTIKGIRFLFFGGAESVDCLYRIEGVSWWRKESPSVSELNRFLHLIDDFKPDVICTHEAPKSFRPLDNIKDMFSGQTIGGVDFQHTARALENIYNSAVHKPKKWFYGHHHILDRRIDEATGTEFICTGINGEGFIMDSEFEISSLY